MRRCSIPICGNQSDTVNIRTCGVIYHRYPHIAEYKEKWIEATGNKDWFPRVSEVICSRHFEEKCYATKDKRRLFKWAVPTLSLQLELEPTPDPKLSTYDLLIATLKMLDVAEPLKNRVMTLLDTYIRKYKTALLNTKIKERMWRSMAKRYKLNMKLLRNLLTVLRDAGMIGPEYEEDLEYDHLLLKRETDYI